MLPTATDTLTSLRQRLHRRETTSVAVTTALLARIGRIDPTLQSCLTVMADQALAAAESADQRIAAGEQTPLLGVPVAVKDLFCTAGTRTTAGSRILDNFIPPYDAFAVERLRQAGAVIIAKTNTDEFAMGSSTENSAFGITRNPWDTDRVPGGSSGGSAAAVAAHLAYGALGTDTGGSVRQPAAFCGIVGIRPTYGRVSRYGVVAFASSLDQPGCFGRTVADTAALLQVVAGHDPHDSTSIPAPVPDYLAGLTRSDLRGIRVGIPAEYFIDGIDPDVEQAVRSAIETLAALGATIHPVSLPHTRYALPVYYLIAPAEASANLARYDGVRYGPRVEGADMIESVKRTRALFGPEVQRRIMLGTYALSAGYYEAYYGRALKARTLIADDFKRAFAHVDVIATPTSPTTAFRIGEKSADPLSMYLSDIFTISLNLSAGCGLSLPCGFDRQGLPIGLQLLGDTLQEALLLQIAACYEQATPWHTHTPPLVSTLEQTA
jgi:aspartyl-tRNA(Asn)/glutamyl-tRNA(Gln) amidotransferase subunit A